MQHRKKIIIISASLTALLIATLIFAFPTRLFNSPVSAVLKSSDGTLLSARIASDGQWRFPPSDNVPDKFARCIVTYEDKRFFRHLGVDPLAVARAFRLNLGKGEIRSGASTLTMQVIRLSRPGCRRSIGEKIIEALLATRMELQYRKSTILALYASNAPFGGNVVGLDAAAWRYFGRAADELSWAESAMLAVLPNSPALIHPGKNRELLLKKRNFLIDKLCQSGIIDEEAAELAKDEPLPDKPYPMPDICSHLLERLRKECGDKMYATSIDVRRQLRVEEILKKDAESFSSNNVFNIAAIVLDVHNAEPLIYCGNIKREPAVHGENVDVIQAPRSSGSTLKPLLYAAMIDEGTLLPQMLVDDTPFHYRDFSPSNFSHTYDGAVPAKSVIQRSLNVPSVRMLDNYGIEKFIGLLKKLGFTTITRGGPTYGLSLILGGAEITLEDLARCYCTLAAALQGERTSPIGNGALWCMFDALTEVGRPEEEGDWHSFSSSRKVAWKTGTSYGNRDGWSIGVTPDYVVGVWVGNCNGEGRPLLTGIGYAAPVMFELFNLLPQTGWFDMPTEELTEVICCSKSGYPASNICTERDTVVTARSNLKVRQCPFHRLVHLSPDGNYQVNSDCCPASLINTTSRFVLPPAQEWYYMKSHSDYHRLPPLHPAIAGNSGNNIINIIYPQEGMVIATPTALDGESRGCILTAAHNDGKATIFWHLDGTYIGQTSRGEHKIAVTPSPGSHTLTIVDANGNSASVRFKAK